MRGKPLVLKQLVNGCIIPISHKLNQDGYFRCRDPRYKGNGMLLLLCIIDMFGSRYMELYLKVTKLTIYATIVLVVT